MFFYLFNLSLCFVTLSLKKIFYNTTGYSMLQFRINSAAHLNQKPGISIYGAKMFPLEPSF